MYLIDKKCEKNNGFDKEPPVDSSITIIWCFMLTPAWTVYMYSDLLQTNSPRRCKHKLHSKELKLKNYYFLQKLKIMNLHF